MLAYSSISHSGFVLCAIIVGTSEANAGLFLYWIMFLFVNFGAFGMLFITESTNHSNHINFNHPYSKFKGVIKTSPLFAISMAIFMFCLAGIPPFGIFWGKVYIINSVVNSEYFYLAIIMALNSAIAMYFYLKLVIVMFMYKPTQNINLNNSSNLVKFILVFTLLCSVFTVIFVEPMINFIKSLIV